MNSDILIVHGPRAPETPLVLDSPHSGYRFPADFGAVADTSALRDGEDCFIDTLYMPATERGVPLLAAQFPRTYLDPNRHAADIDLELLQDGVWPHDHVPSGKGRLGKALIWRLVGEGQPIYDRKLSVDEVCERVRRYHQPYHQALRALIDAAHAAFGVSVHLNCHSMNAISGSMGVAGPGVTHADIVLGDRDGSTCHPALTAFVRDMLTTRGYEVKVNDPFKGVELVRAYSDPAAGRHSLQIEVNKRLYMDEATRQPHAGFAHLQADLLDLVDALRSRYMHPDGARG
ncbi:MAG: N-formylglutamate amidohydrolase [Betaproteobacteria bacterium]